MEQTLQAIATHLNGQLIGNGAVLIRALGSLDSVREGELTFIEDPRQLPQAMKSRASAVIVPQSIRALDGRSGISVPHPRLAFIKALELFHPPAAVKGVIHPTAVLGEQARISPGVDIRAHTVIGARARVGRGSVIEAGAYVGDDAAIGEDCLIGPNVVVYERTVIGNRVRIHGGSVIGGDGFGYVFHESAHVKVPQVGNVVIEDDVEIGCNVCVDRATMGSTLIQRGTKIDNLVQIAHNDRIGRHVILCGQAGLSGSVTIGDHTMLGGKAGVVDHVTIGEQVQVAAASVVTKSIPSKTRVWGFPARPSRETLQQMASLARLPTILKALSGLGRRLSHIEARLRRMEAGRPPPGQTPAE